MNNQKHNQEDNFVSDSDSEKIDSKNNHSRQLYLKEILEMEKEASLILKIKKEVEAKN